MDTKKEHPKYTLLQISYDEVLEEYQIGLRDLEVPIQIVKVGTKKIYRIPFDTQVNILLDIFNKNTPKYLRIGNSFREVKDFEDFVNIVSEYAIRQGVRFGGIKLYEFDPESYEKYLENSIRVIKKILDTIFQFFIFGRKKVPITEEFRRFLSYYIFGSLTGEGIISLLRYDDSIEEIMINGSKMPVYVYHAKYGKLRTNVQYLDEYKLYLCAKAYGDMINRPISQRHPVLDLSLPDNSRVQVTIPPASITGTLITVRKAKRTALSILHSLHSKILDPLTAAFLLAMGQSDINVIFVGNTGSAKSVPGHYAVFVKWNNKQYILALQDIFKLGIPIEKKKDMEVRTLEHLDLYVWGMKNGEPAWVKVRKVIRHKHEGPLIEVTGETFKVVTTPDHNFFIKEGDKLLVVPAKDLTKYGKVLNVCPPQDIKLPRPYQEIVEKLYPWFEQKKVTFDRVSTTLFSLVLKSKGIKHSITKRGTSRIEYYFDVSGELTPSYHEKILEVRTVHRDYKYLYDLETEDDSQSFVVIGEYGTVLVHNTTHLMHVLNAIPPEDRLIIIEEVPELLVYKEHVIRLLTTETVPMERHVESTLRMRPDRVTLGEIRRPEEFQAYAKSLVAGQAKASYATAHAETSIDILKRFREYGIPPYDVTTLNYIVVLRRETRITETGRIDVRKLKEITEVQKEIDERGYPILKKIVQYDYEKDIWRWKVDLEDTLLVQKLAWAYGIPKKKAVDKIFELAAFLKVLYNKVGTINASQFVKYHDLYVYERRLPEDITISEKELEEAKEEIKAEYYTLRNLEEE